MKKLIHALVQMFRERDTLLQKLEEAAEATTLDLKKITWYKLTWKHEADLDVGVFVILNAAHWEFEDDLVHCWFYTADDATKFFKEYATRVKMVF